MAFSVTWGGVGEDCCVFVRFRDEACCIVAKEGDNYQYNQVDVNPS